MPIRMVRSGVLGIALVAWAPSSWAKCPLTRGDEQALGRNGWESLRLAKALGDADMRSASKECRERLATVGRRVAQFLDEEAAYLRVPDPAAAAGRSLRLYLDGQRLGEQAFGLPPGLALRPGNHELRVQSAAGKTAMVGRVSVSGVPFELDANGRALVSLQKGANVLEWDVRQPARQCALIHRLGVEVAPSLAEGAPTVILHGGSESLPLSAPHALEDGDYALEVVREPGANAEVDVLVYLDGSALLRRQVRGSGVRHLLPIDCSARVSERSELLVRVVPAGVVSVAPPEVTAIAEADDYSRAELWFWGGVTSVAVGATVAAVSYWGAQRPGEREAQRLSDLGQCPPQGTSESCPGALRDRIDSSLRDADTGALWANIGLGVAGAGAVALAVAWYLDSRSSSDSAEPTAWVVPVVQAGQFGCLVGRSF